MRYAAHLALSPYPIVSSPDGQFFCSNFLLWRFGALALVEKPFQRRHVQRLAEPAGTGSKTTLMFSRSPNSVMMFVLSTSSKSHSRRTRKSSIPMGMRRNMCRPRKTSERELRTGKLRGQASTASQRASFGCDGDLSWRLTSVLSMLHAQSRGRARCTCGQGRAAEHDAALHLRFHRTMGWFERPRTRPQRRIRRLERRGPFSRFSA